MKNCDCNERIGIEINTWKQFEDLKKFFDNQVRDGIFADIAVKLPFYVGYDGERNMEWYADKWYKCNVCECLWEFIYPDFPAKGLVRKFPNGEYSERSQYK